MASIPVFAETLSRLHADIAVVRLIRAGIAADKISAVFPQRRAPNSVCCWLKHFNQIPFSSAIPMAAAGLLGRLFKSYTKTPKFGRELEVLGLSPALTKQILERTEAGSVVVCVHARNETQASIAWHIFQHVGVENITCPAGADLIRSPIEVASPQISGAGLVAA
jgi:hypothetical protein